MNSSPDHYPVPAGHVLVPRDLYEPMRDAWRESFTREQRNHPIPDGPALLYVSDDDVVYRLDRMPPPGNPLIADDRMPDRDRLILTALWGAFRADGYRGGNVR